ncbi:N-acetylglucosamine-6-phosphate deacetylase [Bacillus velezensis]|uniref:N-acetylglucosamine-6-phosphate deacetylase n=1 Tax=Bacillus TaxID=1386 RepID=UPI001C52ACF3|nr:MULTISPECIES: N-acetylglucosamine-6-phosphate deacetylase [Bacillus amyloliquefaciens group]QXP96556.1 N-acetylglucosamine-6-phosphate deacetylase [Bacillus velezensis]UHH02412.1 N-acetylglucosamine-6-phosphate deacetylase [Bacillus amyloliquefaciens]ULR22157.1 N-acetylglucosamine-6-phosphate deacetylase [Bacillus velezensis]UVW08923.1 N-acetylglucosamine-6-phosphate deacetylase [Bacillus velezensis]WHL76239.1 N-acetylglucosamine-6-phosphate deacetylase [Bacillus velezensis]
MQSSTSFNSPAYLETNGVMKIADITYSNNEWLNFDIGGEGIFKKSGSYLVPSLPVEFHCHGIGHYDFSNLDQLDIEKINTLAEIEGIFCVPSIFLPHNQLDQFAAFMKEFHTQKRKGRYRNILGISLEGPLLASFAGTPEKGNWAPLKEEWEKIASCGEYGLIYTVLSPDAMTENSYLKKYITEEHPSLEWIVDTLVEAGVKPALGHFQKAYPEETSELIMKVIDTAQKRSNYTGSDAVLTDHLFNDMPNNFKHTWRTPQERVHRLEGLKDARLDKWNIDNINTLVGEVPGTLMRAAKEGLLTICMNFDSEHVDLEVARRVVELVGSKGIIALTDRIDTDSMCGQSLEKIEGNNLWYQGKGYVAAGSYTIDRLMHNIRAIGFNEKVVWNMTSFVPLKACHFLNELENLSMKPFSFIDETKKRAHFKAPAPELILR